MRSRVLLLAGVVAVLLASSFVGVSSADTWVKDTSLSIGKSPSGATAPGDRVLIHGRLGPKACRAGKTIQLTQVRSGPDVVLDSDTTDKDGEYSFVLHPRDDMRVRARFRGSVETSYGHSHTCKKSKSERGLIQVT